MKIAKLRHHPLQESFFVSPTDEEVKKLAASLESEGQREPLQVMPPVNKAGLAAYTILDGHSRLAAAVSLGWTEIDVIIRDDLVDADAAEVERLYLQFNTIRRQLDPLERARIACRQVELETGKSWDSLRFGQYEEAKQRVGKILDQSNRNLNRYLNILETPIEVQRAFRTGRLKLVSAAKVARLPKQVQQQIAKDLQFAGPEQYNGIAERYIMQNDAIFETHRTKHPMTKIFRWLGEQAQQLEALEGVGDHIHGPTLAQHLPTLLRLEKLINVLLKVSRKPGGDLATIANAFLEDGIAANKKAR